MNTEPARILVNLLWPIGDTLFTTPALHALRRHFPRARIVAFAYRSNAPVLVANPDIDRLYIHPTGNPAREWLRLPARFREIRGERPDLAIDFNGLSWVLSRVIAGAPRRVQTPFPPGWWINPERNQRWRHRHCVEHALDTVAQVGVPRPEQPRLHYTVTHADRAAATGLMTRFGLRPEELVVIHPGGEGMAGRKRWPADRFAVVADGLQRQGLRVVLVGGPTETDLGQAIERGMQTPVIDLIGQTTLRTSGALLESARLFIGNDSAPLHIATALRRPVIGIYGPSNVGNFHPWAPDSPAITLHGQPPCFPCFTFAGGQPIWAKVGCEEQVCLQETTPARVLAAARQLLSEALPQARLQPLPTVHPVA